MKRDKIEVNDRQLACARIGSKVGHATMGILKIWYTTVPVPVVGSVPDPKLNIADPDP